MGSWIRHRIYSLIHHPAAGGQAGARKEFQECSLIQTFHEGAPAYARSLTLGTAPLKIVSFPSVVGHAQFSQRVGARVDELEASSSLWQVKVAKHEAEVWTAETQNKTPNEVIQRHKYKKNSGGYGPGFADRFVSARNWVHGVEASG